MKIHFFPGAHRPSVILISLAILLSNQVAAWAAQAGGSRNQPLDPVSLKHKIQVKDPTLAAQLVAQGARLIGDYGGFQLLAMPKFDSMLQTNNGVEWRDQHNLIQLNTTTFDTTDPTNQTARQVVGPFQGRRLHLVQFAGPTTPEWRDALITNGVQIITYVPNNAYLVSGDAPALAAIQTLASNSTFIQWEGTYQDSHKIHPKARPVDGAGQPRSVGTDWFAIQLLADGQANTNTLGLLDQLKLEPFRRCDSVLKYVDVVLRLPSTNLDQVLAQIAAQPDVVSIHPHFEPRRTCERQDQIVAGNLSSGVPTAPGYLNWLASKGFAQSQFDASGLVVDVADSGVDNGTTSPNHLGLHTAGILANSSRVVYSRLEGTANRNSSLAGCDGHGTLNAHIIAGYNNLSAFPHLDASGYHYGLGVCPFVKLGASVIFDPTSFTYPNYSNLLARAYNNGARISNNSWGSDDRGDYTIESQAYDALVRDAQMSGSAYSVSGNQGMVVVFAAGNEGESGSTTIDAPGSAKNVITVGASENVQPFGGSDGSSVSDAEADNANDVLSFSSRGPCADGRHKPDLMAPGSHVSGGVAQAANPATTGTAISCFDGEGVSGGVSGSSFFPSGQQYYTASSGSSHATPCVAGACALLRQYFINHELTLPSPAMTKAYLMNSARYLTGASAADSLWSNVQGMGGLNLGMAFDGTSRFLRDQLAADLLTASGQTRVFTGTIADSSKPLRVTVAWTDAPGSTVGNAYNNNLDLTVTVGGKTYKGNVFSGAYSTTGGTADSKNNVESVFLPAGVSGTYTVQITATDINSDGVPNNSYALDQDFALVIYNSGSGPAIQGVSSTLTAESYSPTNGIIDPGETITINVTLANTGTANTTNLVATLLDNNGLTSFIAAQTFGVLATNGAAVTRSFSFIAAGSCGDILTATLELQDGSSDLGTVAFEYRLGALAIPLAEAFDAVTPPNLPTDWSSTTSANSITKWTTLAGTSASSPNAARILGPTNAGWSALVSPVIPITTSSAQLTFRHNFTFETLTNSYHTFPGPPGRSASTNAFDGGVLEIQIGTGAFTDLLSAGGSFSTGGYVRSIYSGSDGDNPLAGRSAWSGSSGGFVSATASLPAAAAGQNIRLRWRLASDSGNYYGDSVWYVDSVSIQDGYSCATNLGDVATTDLAVSQQPIPSAASTGGNLTYVLTITNSGPSAAAGVVLTDTLPATATFLSSSLGSISNGALVCRLGVLNAAAATNITVVVVPASTKPLTNSLSVTSQTSELTPADNSCSLITPVNNSLALAITSPASGQRLSNLLLTASGTAEGGFPVAVVYCRLNSNAWVRAEGTSNWTAGFTLSQATNLLRAYAVDSMGNLSATNTVSFNYVGHFLTEMTGSFAGLFYDTNGITQSNAGAFTASLARSGKFSASLKWAGTASSLSGTFSSSGFYSGTMTARGVVVQLQLDLLDGNTLHGFLSNRLWTAELTAYRNLYSTTNPAPQGGLKYAIVLPGTDDSPALPTGSSYGLLTVARAGTVTFSGQLADSTTISQSSFVSPQGSWPLYASLYSGKGLLLGWLAFTTNEPNRDLSGSVHWIKPRSSATLYPEGFHYTQAALGSLYTCTSGVPLLNLTNGTLILDSFELRAPITNSLYITPQNKVIGSNKLTLSFTTNSGVFQGSVTNRLAGKVISVKGILLQNQNRGAGFFLGTNQSGTVFLGNQ